MNKTNVDLDQHEGFIHCALHKPSKCHLHGLQCKWCPLELCSGPGGNPEEEYEFILREYRKVSEKERYFR